MKYNKYSNKKIKIDNILFDSIAESRRYEYLKSLEKLGKISNLILQPIFLLSDSQYILRTPKRIKTGNRKCDDKFAEVLISEVALVNSKVPPIKYIADFQYKNNLGVIVEDVKGMLTDTYRLKRTLFLSKYLDSILQFQEVVVSSGRITKYKLRVFKNLK